MNYIYLKSNRSYLWPFWDVKFVNMCLKNHQSNLFLIEFHILSIMLEINTFFMLIVNDIEKKSV
uniref:CSON010012 protein n=1 Tax=Culicoides sonorensis TaxID=179676 RepID=A0A336N308_CULSO